ncbi:transcription elongation factor Spt5 [Candidatus Micrarchaeota archaeon CG08_land_8_20_14_0_20_49_17]|nr:MAG: transcription elongation factor Spt5 [Candidatus Micrarchaeota archaeon CG1_02_49_24]PIU09279.1 MAG: transcription elongation factor Spt5 [Candidatus Micrarchaeota archaeon CG08_land_8_20_14_0_20_49_17]PIZ98603.1 MAG: transcription elongation factor Spt5 [Candidatus Micrarchaeota archaeon CG_4_10_14_0_2_um_filter_49_7]
MFAVYRVTAGQERVVAEILAKKSRTQKLDVFAIAFIDKLNGYLLIEVSDMQIARELGANTNHIKELLRKEVSFDEIKHLLKPATGPAVKIDKGDVVDIVSGPFKNEKGRVLRVDEAKGEITVELIEIAIAVPVTISINNVKLVSKAGAESQT